MRVRLPRRWATGRFRRPERSLLGLLLALAPVLVPGTTQAEARNSVALQIGTLTDNTWQDILFESDTVVARDSSLAGIILSREWPLWRIGYVGAEAQLNLHWGEQDLWEVVAPVYLRSLRPERWFIPSLAYGLGLSWTSDVPEVELDRRGESQKLLAFWFIELELASRAQLRPFVRLHHRSDAFGAFPTDTGSNALMLGLRRDF